MRKSGKEKKRSHAMRRERREAAEPRRDEATAGHGSYFYGFRPQIHPVSPSPIVNATPTSSNTHTHQYASAMPIILLTFPNKKLREQWHNSKKGE
jgi:hypothetical protein